MNDLDKKEHEEALLRISEDDKRASALIEIRCTRQRELTNEEVLFLVNHQTCVGCDNGNHAQPIGVRNDVAWVNRGSKRNS